MQELRFVAVSEDGRYAVLAVPGRSARFTLPIDERLRAIALGQTSRLVQYEIEVESPLRPKEIQARIRAGETVEEIADAAGIAVERVRWFEGPVLAERAYIAGQAQTALVRRQGDAIPSSPGPRLGEIVTERLKMLGADPEEAQWDARKLGDGSWQVQLTFISGDRPHRAEWVFDPRRRHVLPADDNAARMSLPDTEPPQSAALAPGEATVTHLAPRLSSAAGHGGSGYPAPSHAGSGYGPGGISSSGNGGRPRHERPGAGRPAVPEPQVPEPEAPEPRDASVPAAVTPSAPSAPQVSPAGPATVAAQAPRSTDFATAAPSVAAASPAAPVTPGSAAAPPAETPAEPASEQAHQRRKAARGRRSSVPSWDEIMFGNSRQRD